MRCAAGQLALAALRSGLKAHGVRMVKYLEHAARKAQQVGRAGTVAEGGQWLGIGGEWEGGGAVRRGGLS